MTVPLSVIIPCYHAQYDISGAVESLTKQKIGAELVLVSDDGQDYRPLVEPYRTTLNIQFLSTNHVGTGPSNAKNIGLSKCRGDAVLILDSDDFLDDDFLEYTLPVAMTKGACLTPRRPVDYTNKSPVITRAIGKLSNYSSHTQLSMAEYVNFPLGWQTLYRRDMLQEKWEESIRFEQDLILECHIIERIGYMPFLPKMGYNYRVRKGSICHSDDSAINIRTEYADIARRIISPDDGMGFSPNTQQILLDFIQQRFASIDSYLHDKLHGTLRYEPVVIADILQYPASE